MADDWRAEYEARRAEEEAPARDTLRDACGLLARLGVRTLHLAYDGEDGAGSVFGLALEPRPAAGIPDGLEAALRDAAYWLLPPGWEIDAGSCGTLAIDVRTRKARRDHHRRLRATEQDAAEFDL